MDNQSLNNNFSNRRTYAGLAIRFLARLTDWFILFTPQALFWWWSGRSIDSIASLTSNLILYITLFLVLGFVISLLYYSLSTTYWGATPGKLLVGLRVSGEDGQNLALGRSLFRHSVGYWVSALLWGLGYFWIVRDKNKQGWHDQISGSYVVHQGKSRWPLLLIILIALLSIDTVAAASGIQEVITNKELKRDIEDLGRVLEESFPSTEEEQNAPQEKQFFDAENHSKTDVKTNVKIEINEPQVKFQYPEQQPAPPPALQQDSSYEAWGTEWERQLQEIEEQWQKQQEEFEKKKQENQQWFEQQQQQMQLQ